MVGRERLLSAYLSEDPSPKNTNLENERREREFIRRQKGSEKQFQ